jgi:hypothetical protein
MAAHRHDVFISYAHADDEVAVGASSGWVTTLAAELRKVLRRKLGGHEPSIWMDHQLAANIPVEQALIDTLRASRTLLLVMSPGYQRSTWCERELGNFLAASRTIPNKNNVFLVEIEPVARERWQPALRSLTGIRFWEKRFEEQAARLMGFPVPKADEDNPYWRNLNELAHLIARHLVDQSAESITREQRWVLVAEATDDLLDRREQMVAALRQHQFDVLPATDYPRDSEASYARGVREDLLRAPAFVQLFGQFEGRKPSGSDASFVALQAREVVLASARRPLEILQWRPNDLDLESLPVGAYRELLRGKNVQASRFEAFKQATLEALSSPQVFRSVTPSSQPAPNGDLMVYVNAAVVDQEVADRVVDSLHSLGVSVALSMEHRDKQSPAEIRRAQEEGIKSSDGVVIVYGRSPISWVQAQFAVARKALATRGGVWGALVDAGPEDKPPPGLRSRSLLTLNCRRGFDSSQISAFIEALRSDDRGAHA